ncbi:MAG: hypothetical protein CL927_15180, partial [Deltaproteobacteria bacterium]|nr:hypothetical protein [Deltaproteobacteria bacterium]
AGITAAVLNIVGCGSSDKDDTDTNTDIATGDTAEGTSETIGGILPQAGDWSIVTSGWSVDDCNAAQNLEAQRRFVLRMRMPPRL